ncbi:uncharacterized protein PG998_013671 [Apiospora kogelbergensis]|uniref:uncharacterized protein n=1 Tax=Apiospora kogelbergensis TaxID=1337665 RepID=UPI00312DDB96
MALKRSTANGQQQQPVAVKALYFINNKVPNQLVATEVHTDGQVGDPVFYPTGGDGSSIIHRDTGKDIPTDTLSTQDSVKRMGNYLFACNAGSNTISTFKINPEYPTELHLFGDPVSTIGDFPVTIAVSAKLGLVAVATAGIQNGLVVYNFDEHEGLCPDGLGVRPFGINQFNPPIFEGDGASDAFFSEDDKLLFVTVKGDTMNDPGFLSVYPIIGGNVAVKDVRSSPEGTHLLFGAFQIAGTRKLFVSDSQFGTVILKIGDDDEGDTVAKTVIPPGIQGSCWAEYSPVSKSAWVTNPVTNNLVELDVETNAILSQTDITINKTKGMLDFVVPGNFLYALGAATDKEPSSMLVLDISKGKVEQVQNFVYDFGTGYRSQGLEYYA